MNHATLHRATSRARPSKKSADPIAAELHRYTNTYAILRGLTAGTCPGKAP